jgi:uroporphyrinogen-III synthase
MPTTVLLTRPEDDSKALAEILSQQGYASFIEPMLRIVALPSLLLDTYGLQAVMLTSAHALDFVTPGHLRSPHMLNLPCFCVGTRTAQTARQFGFTHVHDAVGDGMALANLMVQQLKPEQGGLLHIAGRDRDDYMHEKLRAGGYKIHEWVTYAAEKATSLSVPLIEALRDQRLQAALFFSSRTAQAFSELVKGAGLQACCQSMIALGISGAVLDALRDLPWQCTYAAVEPSEESMLSCLREHLPSGKP